VGDLLSGDAILSINRLHCRPPVSTSRKKSGSKLDGDRLMVAADRAWTEFAEPALCDYIRIPNKSPAFDVKWREHGHMDKAVALVEAWCRRHAPAGAEIEVIRLDGRTPVI